MCNYNLKSCRSVLKALKYGLSTVFRHSSNPTTQCSITHILKVVVTRWAVDIPRKILVTNITSFSLQNCSIETSVEVLKHVDNLRRAHKLGQFSTANDRKIRAKKAHFFPFPEHDLQNV